MLWIECDATYSYQCPRGARMRWTLWLINVLSVIKINLSPNEIDSLFPLLRSCGPQRGGRNLTQTLTQERFRSLNPLEDALITYSKKFNKII